ncbi:MAG TPA: CobD/CbiB family protein [Casimicrobiaceae bacterium]|nr:CobD/CbiB family protein [Casimicrobiaceae bacterium]
MKLIAILLALGLEQWHASRWRATLERGFVRIARRLERNLNGGRSGQGVLAMLVAIVPPVIAVALLHWLALSVHPLVALAFNALVLYLLMGFRRFSHAISSIVAAFRDNDVIAARRVLAAWRGGYTSELSSQEISKLAIERGLVDAYRQVFAVLFWFTVLPGAAGAMLYRATLLLAQEWRGAERGDEDTPIVRSRSAFGLPVRRLLTVLDWVPVRLTALSFAIVGDFEDAAWCWRTQPPSWTNEPGGVDEATLLASGAGALGVQLGGPIAMPGTEPVLRPDLGVGELPEPEVLPSAVGLVWRALVLWVLVVVLVTLANLAG